MNNHLLIQTALCIIHSALLLPTAAVVADEKKTEVNPIGAMELTGAGIKLSFDTAENGFGCLSIENRLGAPVAFGHATQGGGGFWQATFWRDGNPSSSTSVSNLSPCISRNVERIGDTLRFTWHGLTLGTETGVVDVVAAVSLSDAGNAAEWRLSMANRSGKWGLASTTFPVFRKIVRSGEATALLPDGCWGGRLLKNFEENNRPRLIYPWYGAGGAPVQTLAYMIAGAGLQITALDGKSQEKTFGTEKQNATIWYRCPDEGRPGAANTPDFAVETAVFRGDWWVAAKRYRKWALQQEWAAKGPLSRRGDFNRRIGDVGFWLQLWKGPVDLTNIVDKTIAAFPDIPLGVHWYTWHKIPFDHSYPEFKPAREGVSEALQWLSGRVALTMPYMNGRIWDTELPSFTNAYAGACKKPGGKDLYVYRYASPRKMTTMCPTTSIWREKMMENTTWLVDELGADGIYLDQVAMSGPDACHDPSHGHPFGGGSWWTDGYRGLLEPIRRHAVEKGVPITVEGAIEPLIDSVDGFLVWDPRMPDDVPLLPAVYSGYTVYFGSPSDIRDSLGTFFAIQARDFLWGCQLGWQFYSYAFYGMTSRHNFVAALCRERLSHKDFMLYGELLGEISISSGAPYMDVKLNRMHTKKQYNGRLPSVMGTVWKDAPGQRICAFLVNASDTEQIVSWSFDGTPFAAEQTDTLPPYSVRSFIRNLAHQP